jgi:predicted anti-sigma-YlaC factor YlaD
MKHKQYESWILDEAPLTEAQQQKLDAHLKVCESCRVLHGSWISSKQLISQSATQVPVVGFTDRWQITILKKCRIEKVRRYRLTLFGLILLAFAGSVIYMLISGSFMQMFANGFTMISEIVMGVTNGLSTISYWLSRLPIAVPVTAGFIFFGMINAFVMVGIFFLWNLMQRKLLADEIPVE